jgi:signal transduction histidine kinase
VAKTGGTMSAFPTAAELIHEIRNALAVARANVEGVLDGKLEPTHDRLRSVLQALHQVEALVSDLPSLPAATAMQVQPRLMNVCELLNREFQAVEGLARAKNVHVAVHRCPVPAAPCLHFYGDPVRISQIVMNLMVNAVRYTPAGGSVSIECTRKAEQLEVRISDTGPGVPEEERERIFAHKVRGTAGHDAPGSGYGLAIVKQLVEAQGGSVSVTAASERGALFTVRLPGVPCHATDLCITCPASH